MSAFSRPLGENDLASFLDGTHTGLAQVLGAHHLATRGGTQFAGWAPRARSVSVIGDFNGWSYTATPLQPAGAGIWSGFAANTWPGSRYKYRVVPANGEHPIDKADPFAFTNEPPPQNASLIWDLDYKWLDEAWMLSRPDRDLSDAPISIYELHLGSWRRAANNRWLSYRQLADELVPYVREMGFTHVEFLPVMEHPFYGSWGYQATGYFAPTSRYGSPQDFMQLIDSLHQSGIGVILDWVPSHFATDEHGLGFFDGAPEYEPQKRNRAIHPDWHSYVFEYARSEVRSFLLSSALFWLEVYHADALRVDAVASLLYLDYSRGPKDWTPNRFGTNQNLDAIAFLQLLNEQVHSEHPQAMTVAEDSTAWPRVTGPKHKGGLGFDLKWDLGWMHDTLQYLAHDPIRRKHHHGTLTFRAEYAFRERFVLPLSHDEVVHGKRSLLSKMPGDAVAKLANLRLLLAYMYALPGKKLLFMGGEFGCWREWDHDGSLDWSLLARPEHAGLRLLVGDLNRLYRTEPALFRADNAADCFQWIQKSDSERNVIAFLRRGDQRTAMVVCNFSGIAQRNYRLGVPTAGFWQELLNSDGKEYGGLGIGNFGGVEASPFPLHRCEHSITVEVGALSAVYLARA